MDFKEYIRLFNSSSREYVIHKFDDQLSNVQRSLQVLSASSDPSIFDLSDQDVVNFFVNLYELMLNADVNSTVTWGGINVLLEACRNCTTRKRLTLTYKFSPILTKFLRVDQRFNDKNIKVLQLLQELTYDVHITWQESHLGTLISTLTKWIVGSDQELILLSLGVLVNVCYKNIPAVYTLMRTVEIKKFIKIVLKLQRNNDALRVQVCKLLIILQDVSGGVPDEEICIYIKSICPTLIEALHSGSSCLMRHVVNFFEEIVTNPKSSHVISNYKSFGNDADKLLSSLKENDISPECVRVLFEYLGCLVKLDSQEVQAFCPRILQLAFRWISTDEISTDCLKLLNCVVTELFSMNEAKTFPNMVLDILDEHISVILLILVDNDTKTLTSDHYNKLTVVLKLLAELLKEPKLAEKIICSIKQSEMEKLFSPLINLVLKDSHFFQEPTYTFYVQALLFLTELADKETNWFLIYRELLREKQVQMMLSVALYVGPEAIKKQVLHLIGTTGFSTDCVGVLAGCMNEFNKLILFSPLEKSVEEQRSAINVSHIPPMDITPMMSITQEGYLNSLLEKYENVAKSNDNSAISSLMELYQLKMSAMNQTLRCMQASQEAADLRATRLQHCLALTTCEVSRLHQLLYGTQKTLEANAIEASKYSKKTIELESQVKEIHNKYDQVVQTLRSKTKIVSEQNEQIDQLTCALKEKENFIEQLQEEQKLLKITVEGLKKEKSTLEENVECLQKTISDAKKEHEINLKQIGVLKKEIMAQSDMISELQKSNSEKEIEIGNLCKELQEHKRTRERMLELAMGKN